MRPWSSNSSTAPPQKKSKKKIICKLLPLEMKWDITTDPVDIKWKK
jgi:hypothetical protein